MKGGSKLFLIAGVGLAVVAVALLATSMRGKEKADAGTETEVKKVTVVEAVVAIPAHSLLTAENLIEVEVDESEATADSVTSKAEVIGQAYSVNLVQGQRLLKSQTEKPGIGNIIEPGKRAASLPATDVNLLSGLIQDGDYVDVIFHARINLVRVLPTNLAETLEDEPYYKYSGGGGSGGGSGSSSSDDEEDDSGSGIDQSESGPIAWVPAGIEFENHPAVGDEGSTFLIRDDIKDEQQFEPVAKVIVQNVKVLRVVRPGQSFDSTGADASALAGDENTTGIAMPAEGGGFLILEVSPEQAEVLTFMQDGREIDYRHKYQVVVRAKDDHEIVETSGITFEILATEEEWSMPWPEPVTAPNEQAAARSSNSGSDEQE